MSKGLTDAVKHPSRSSRMKRVRHWIQRVLGIDRAIGFTVIARSWSLGAGAVTLILIAHFLTPAEQGYYYTFSSLVALQIVFELGFSFVILQLAAHERAILTINENGNVSGDAIAHGRLASVLQRAIRWYSFAALLMAAILFPVGLHFFGSHQAKGSMISWHLPWIAVVLTAVLTFQMDPIFSFLEGCGFVSQVARMRVGQAIWGSLLAWIALIVHHGLFSPAMAILGQASVGAVFLFNYRRLLLGLWRHSIQNYAVSWKNEILPFQWRIAVSWLCGYFIFQLYNPVLFAYRGAVAAGQMGMSLSLANALQTVAISWMNTKAAPFGGMIARKEYKRLDQVFFQTLKQSVAVFSIGSLIIWLASVYLSFTHSRIATRIINPMAFGFLLCTSLLTVIVSAEALYLRAHKQEKFLLNSILGALFVGPSTYFFGRYYGAPGIVTANFVISIGLGFGFGTFTFLKYRRLWHAK